MIWINVRKVSNSRIVASTSIWVFVVPALIKIIGKMSLVDLPINFIILYFSGVSFFLASMAYFLFCPSMVKEFDGFKQFFDNGGSGYTLQKYVYGICERKSIKLKDDLVEAVGDATSGDIDNDVVSSISIGVNEHVFIYNNEKISEVFWVLYYFFASDRKIAALLSTTFYFLGFLGIAYMFCLNFKIVVNSL